MSDNKVEMTQNGNNTFQVGEMTGGHITVNYNQVETYSTPFMNREYSATLTDLCKSVDVFFNKIGMPLLRNPSMYSDKHLISNDFHGWLAKLKDFFSNFNTDAMIMKFPNISAKYPLSVLAEYVIALSPDIAVELNTFYHTRIVYVIDCIYKYTEKPNEYYIALGVLGLAADYSDEKIYECAVSDLLAFFTIICNVLDAYTNEIDYSEAENEAAHSMNDNIYNSIRFCFNKKLASALKILFDKGRMIDLDLANEMNIEVTILRKILYPATKSFLCYKYHSPVSTEIWISEPYKTAIREHYNKLFTPEVSV